MITYRQSLVLLVLAATATACSASADGDDGDLATDTAAARCLDCDPGNGDGRPGRGGGGAVVTPWRAEPVPLNQSINLLNYASQIIEQDHLELNMSGDLRARCVWAAHDRAAELARSGWGDGVRAIYYFNQESNVFGVADGPGHCYRWLYDANTPRVGLLSTALISVISSTTTGPVYEILNQIPEIRDANRKINGIWPMSFGFHMFESADVCLLKAERYRAENGFKWLVWTHQANNCLAIFSRESFAR